MIKELVGLDLEKALLECELRNPRKKCGKKHIANQTIIVGNKPIDKLKGMSKIDYRMPKDYLENYKVRWELHHPYQKWIDFTKK